jgi:hypothetical protein
MSEVALDGLGKVADERIGRRRGLGCLFENQPTIRRKVATTSAELRTGVRVSSPSTTNESRRRDHAKAVAPDYGSLWRSNG